MSTSYVSQVLRHDIGARYTRIQKVPYLGNSVRCLLLRQQYAKFMLGQLASGVRVINLDQTWINDTRYLRRKWRLRGAVNSQPDSKVTPRIAVQMAICTSGKLYCSLSQANTDTNTFCLFMSQFARTLTKEDRAFRDSTILLIDGAKYQTSKESLRHMRQLGFKICISAPYSFASAPIEYAFARLKSTDLNPRSIKTGKR